MITTTDVDGIPTLVASTVGQPRAGLSFRVGQADEPLPRRGITHLIEHLALHRLGLADYHYNGATGVAVTHFYTQGSPEDLISYLNAVCDGLNNLPMDRLEMEKEILRTEASGRGRSILEPMAVWRYGARGYGALGYPEWGLHMITPDDLRAWVAQYFTRENAVLWFAGDIPAGLRLQLPSGTRQPVPVVTSALPSTPAFFTGPSRGTTYEAIVKRRPAAPLFAEVLERELFRSLRQESGLSYTAATNYEPRGDGHAAIVALADALDGKQGAVLGGFVDVLAKMRVGNIDRADLDAAVAKAEDALSGTEIDAARLPAVAFDYLTGAPVRETWEIRTDMRTVTVDDLREVATEAWNTGLLMTPEGTDALWAGLAAAPVESAVAAEGTSYKPKGKSTSKLVIGADAAGIVHDKGALTVRYHECEALLAWPDGGRVMIGADGISVQIEPTLFELDPAAMARLEAAIPTTRRVDLPPRDPGDIPQPSAMNTSVGEHLGSGIPEKAEPFPTFGPPSTNSKSSAALSAPKTPTGGGGGAQGKRSTGKVILAIILGLIALGFGCFGVAAVFASFGTPAPGEDDVRSVTIGMAVCSFVVTAALGVAAGVLARKN